MLLRISISWPFYPKYKTLLQSSLPSQSQPLGHLFSRCLSMVSAVCQKADNCDSLPLRWGTCKISLANSVVLSVVLPRSPLPFFSNSYLLNSPTTSPSYLTSQTLSWLCSWHTLTCPHLLPTMITVAHNHGLPFNTHYFILSQRSLDTRRESLHLPGNLLTLFNFFTPKETDQYWAGLLLNSS